MAESRTGIAAFLRTLDLFADLNEAQIDHLAEKVQAYQLDAGQYLYLEGDVTEFFFIIWSGRVRVGEMALLRGDYFGENLLIEASHKEAAVATSAATVLRLWKGHLYRLLTEFPRIKDILIDKARRHQVARRGRIVAFLSTLPLFFEVSDGLLARWADEFQVVRLNAGQMLYQEGEDAAHFGIVWNGRVGLSTGIEKREDEILTLMVGSFFGENLLVENIRRETALALGPARVLRIAKEPFLQMLQDIPGIKATLVSSAKSRRFTRNARITSFLKGIFVFSKIDESRLTQLANEFDVVRLNPGEELYKLGDPAAYAYIMWSGQIGLLTGPDDKRRKHATMVLGDYFGDEVFLEDTMQETAVALEPSKVLRLPKDVLDQFLTGFPDVKEGLSTTAKSRRYARRNKLSWLSEDESVYLITREHEFFLIVPIFLPVLAMVLSGYITLQSLLFGNLTVLAFILPLIVFIITTCVAIWIWIEWHNDFYAVTNRRVIWVEKVILLYNSRQEAPIDTVQSTSKKLNQILRYFIDYGTVIIRTYTGSIVMKRMTHPDHFLYYVNGLKSRVSDIARQTAAEAMDIVIRRRLGIPESKGPLASGGGAVKPAVSRRRSLVNLFKIRIEQGTTVTYRKHWFVLLRQIWFQTLAVVGLFVLAFSMIPSGVFFSPFFVIPWCLGLAILMAWWVYRYLDWSNDIYILTPENVMDIDRKPFTTEEKRVAPLANILSLENERLGFMGNLLNFGTVTVNVGQEKLTFDEIPSPARVQYEIFDRMTAFKQRKAEDEANKERERMADWLAAYHRQVEILENLERSSTSDEL